MSDAAVSFGEWPSPLSPAGAARGGPRFGDLAVTTAADGTALTWYSELVEGANAVFVSVAGRVSRNIPTVGNARSRLNEYGGGAMWAHRSSLFWVEDDDQRIRALDLEGGLEGPVRLLTPPSPEPRAWRYAAGTVEPGGQWMVVERERHVTRDGSRLAEAAHDLAWVPTAWPGEPVEPMSLVEGPDFLAAPVLSPDGSLLAWLQWSHPDMPWDAAELWVGEMVVHAEVGPAAVNGARRLAGGRQDSRAAALGRAISVCLPAWSPEGVLHFCDDADDLWLLRAMPEAGAGDTGAGESAVRVSTGEGEVGEPRWVSGGSRYGFTDDGSVVFAETVQGLDRLCRKRRGVAAEPVDLDVSWVAVLVAQGERAVAIAGFDDRLTSVVELGAGGSESTALLPAASVSSPDPFDFPTEGGATAHGLLYRPRLEGVRGAPGERPPLVVRIHGGPTAHARAELSASVQFWTTRGFAVAEVNHRGSTGFGRAYRDLLAGGWGVVEVQDCIAAAEHLAAAGEVDGSRCVIRGGSAGGFTALAALCSPPTPSGFRFAAATSLYGVTDLAALASGTHKFESRYLDGLVGALPEAAAVYRQRSPMSRVGGIEGAVLVLQGLDDRVVPPEQAEALVDALEAAGVDHEYRTYPGEGHGFRSPDTVADALAAELAFYGRVLGFSPA